VKPDQLDRSTEAKLEAAVLRWVDRLAKKHGVPRRVAALMVLDLVEAQQEVPPTA
jgi:hypothetical protein